jgi:hypothetical protein
MKYFFLLMIFFITSCSLDKNSAYWNEDSIKKSIDDKTLSKKITNINNFRSMTFEEFNLYLKDYSKKSAYPDIDN